MSPIRSLAIGIRDALEEAPEDEFASDPEAAFVKLAQRTAERLAQDGIALLPDRQATATRILAILTDWMTAHPECSLVTRVDLPTGRFELTLRGPEKTLAFFGGGSIQDTCAQAAQVIELGEFP